MIAKCQKACGDEWGYLCDYPLGGWDFIAAQCQGMCKAAYAISSFQDPNSYGNTAGKLLQRIYWCPPKEHSFTPGAWKKVPVFSLETGALEQGWLDWAVMAALGAAVYAAGAAAAGAAGEGAVVVGKGALSFAQGAAAAVAGAVVATGDAINDIMEWVVGD